MASAFYIGCDTTVILNQLTDESNQVVSDATVVGQLFKGTAAVANSTITFTPVDGVPGDYSGIVPGTLTLTEKQQYSLYITVTFISGKIAEFRITRTAVVIDI